MGNITISANSGIAKDVATGLTSSQIMLTSKCFCWLYHGWFAFSFSANQTNSTLKVGIYNGYGEALTDHFYMEIIYTER